MFFLRLSDIPSISVLPGIPTVTTLTFRGEQNGRPPVNRAAIFAYSAADTEIFDDIGLPDQSPLPFGIQRFGLAKLYRLVLGRAMFFADNARYTSRIRKTAVFVEVGPANHRLLLPHLVEMLNCAGRANLTAEGTVVLTIPDTTNQLWRKYSLNPGFKPDCMQGIADAHFHTLATSYTAAEKIFFCKCSRRPDQSRISVPGKRPTRQQHWRECSSSKTGQHRPARQINF